jgi:hypothetical protein
VKDLSIWKKIYVAGHNIVEKVYMQLISWVELRTKMIFEKNNCAHNV